MVYPMIYPARLLGGDSFHHPVIFAMFTPAEACAECIKNHRPWCEPLSYTNLISPPTTHGPAVNVINNFHGLFQYPGDKFSQRKLYPLMIKTSYKGSIKVHHVGRIVKCTCSDPVRHTKNTIHTLDHTR